MRAIRPPYRSEVTMSAVILESVFDLPALWSYSAGNHAHGRLPVLLRVQQLQGAATPQPRSLLRVLFVWLGEVPADPAAAWVLFVAFREITGHHWDFAADVVPRAQPLPAPRTNTARAC